MHRIRLFLNKTLDIASHGWSVFDRIALGSAYVFYSFVRAAGGNYAARKPWRIYLSVCGKKTPLYIKGLLDLYIIDGVVGGAEYDISLEENPEVIFDLGANTGIATVYLKQRHPAAKLYVFEPDPNNEEILRKNFEPFKDDVVFYPAVVAGRAGTMDFYVSREHWSSSLMRKKDTDQVVAIPAVTLDDVMDEHGLDSIDILKFDIEGAEYDVFEHFKNLRAVRSITGEVHMDLADKSLDDFYKLFPQFSLKDMPLHGGRVTISGKNQRYAPRA